MIARLSPYPLKRLRSCIIGQRKQASPCPNLPQLHGKIALVTGANDGNNQMQTEVRENQKEETRGRKAFLRVDDKKELKNPPRI